jgi:hypothetical protein
MRTTGYLSPTEIARREAKEQRQRDRRARVASAALSRALGFPKPLQLERAYRRATST